MAERLGLGLCRGGCDKGSLGFGWGGGIGEEVDLLRDGAAEVSHRLADVGWVVVGFVGILRAGRPRRALVGSTGTRGVGERHVVRDLEHARVHLLQGIDTLLELNVVGRELGLPCAIVNMLSAASPGLGSRRAPCRRPGQPAP
jgi:hypothetical protein